MRHPFAPQFKELGQVTQFEELRELLRTGLEGEFGSMPEFVDLGACPTELRESVSSALFEALSEHAGVVDEDLGWEAASYDHFGGRAWDRLNHTEEVPAPTRVERPADEFLTWWSAVTNDDHIIGTLCAFPTAWDGAIDYQREHGNLGLFDME